MCPTLQPDDLTISTLGTPSFESPIRIGQSDRAHRVDFVRDEPSVLPVADWRELQDLLGTGGKPPLMERVGPRRRLYFCPGQTRAAIVTSGGLCPGINDVVRSIVHTLHFHYDVREIEGIRYGLRGFVAQDSPPLALTPEAVHSIHRVGGSLLGSSRGTPPADAIVTYLERQRIDHVYMIGGDGTQRAVLAISDEVTRRGLRISIVGLPKTIDNDIPFVDRSFGFMTAVAHARDAIDAAHAEARGALNGIGLVKVMGRDSGFIAAHAALASGEANFVLVPEVAFDLDGPRGFLACLERRLLARQHAVIVVAEGAGQRFLESEREALGTDASGNVRLGDVGALIKRRIAGYMDACEMPVTIKYIDPGYMIRSAEAGAFDAVYCRQLGQHAVHAAMAGKTAMMVGRVHGLLVHVPVRAVVGASKKLDPASELWRAVLQSTGQPEEMAARTAGRGN